MNASIQLYHALQHLADGRVYPLIVPENAIDTSPYIVYQPISTQPENTLEGATGYEWVNMQIDIYHHDYDEMIALVSQVIEALDVIKPSEYGGCQYLYDDGLYRALIAYGFWQTV